MKFSICHRFAAVVFLGVSLVACDRSVSSIEPPLPHANQVTQNETALNNPTDALYRRVAALVPAFGGMFMRGADTVVVVLTDASQLQGARDAVRTVFGERYYGMYAAMSWTSITGAFNYAGLAEWRDRLIPLALAIPGVSSVGLRQRLNQVRIGVLNESARAPVMALLVQLEIPQPAVLVQVEPSFTQMTALTDRHRPLTGGFQVRTSSGSCSLGVNGTTGGAPVSEQTRYFLTASHCTDVQGGFSDNTFFYQNTLGLGDFIGGESLDAPTFTGGVCPAGRVCQRADAALIRYHDGFDADVGFIARTLFPNRSEPGSIDLDPNTYPAGPFPYAEKTSIANVDGYHGPVPPMEGQRVDKVGQASGWTFGSVEDLCISASPIGTNFTYVCQTLVSGRSLEGDSGAPVFNLWPGTYSVNFYGIVSLGVQSAPLFTFSPMSAIYSELSIYPYGIFFCYC